MDTLTPISLNEDWRYYFSEQASADYSALVINDSKWIPLLRLEDWAVGAGQSGADWFRRTVVLEPTEACVNYLLRLENVPDPLTVFVNGNKIGTLTGRSSYSFDVTHSVYIGENVIALRLGSVTGNGGFGAVHLIPMPCDPDTDLAPGKPR